MRDITPPTVQSEAQAMADARRRRERMTLVVNDYTPRTGVAVAVDRAKVYRELRGQGVEPHNALIASGIAIELKSGGAL